MIEIGGGIFSLLWLLVVVWAIIRTAQSATSTLAKVLWILILLFFPCLGVLLWLLLGPGRQSL
ncbi:MAG: PLDc N-terminal domain-containing protein [Pirellulaceae bacterium]|nr:PLDc N-terminal domain-containing protein [Pirellulaceae bacterium]